MEKAIRGLLSGNATRGQTATEFLMILVVVLLLLIPVTFFISQQSAESSRVIQARIAVDTLAKTSNFVFYEAPGAVQTVLLTIPGGVDFAKSYIGRPSTASAQILRREINLNLLVIGGDADVFAPTDGDVCGNWPSTSGTYLFHLRKLDSGCVLITPFELGFILSPATYSTTLSPGNQTTFILTAESLIATNQTVTLTAAGGTASFLSFASNPLALPGNGQVSTTVTVTIPLNTTAGTFDGTIIGESDNSSMEIPIRITVAAVGNFTIISSQKANYSVTPYNNSDYNITSYFFTQGGVVNLFGNGWPQFSTVTFDVKNSANASVTSFPRLNTTDQFGFVTTDFDPAGLPTGTYTVYLNNSNTTVTSTVEVVACPT
jgi:hypothetical protein